ncbi:MAG: NIPSNAP family protein [Candidatus Acidiferrales bacterium]
MRNRMLVRSVKLMLVATLALLGRAVATGPLASQARQQRASKGRVEGPEVSRVLEIRSYNLKAGTRERFHQLFEREALPMLRRWKVDVVAYGPSLHDNGSYYLMRAFSSVEDRQRSEDAFYGSDEWRQGPREAILACIESYATAVISIEDVTLQGLRRTGGTGGSIRP